MIGANAVHDTLRKYQLTDGYPLVLDLEQSEGVWMHDAISGKRYLDAFSFFASWPMGYRHPMLECLRIEGDPGGLPPPLLGIGWSTGGRECSEDRLRLEGPQTGPHVVHRFHGRSGYTLSVTNTLPDKIGLFPKFEWPRVHNPAIEFDLDGGIANDIEAEEARAVAEIEAAFEQYGDKIAAILIEPMQGEGGDQYFRREFLETLRRFADEREAMLIYDEVQTGFYSTGTAWMWQQYGVAPDICIFGKKTQVCGIYASPRVEEVPNHVFEMSSRINSTWGGNLADMVRSRRFIEIIEKEDLGNHIAEMGDRLVAGLRVIATDSGGFSNVRGMGSLVAVTLEDGDTRNAMLGRMFDRELFALPSGPQAIRFRLPFVIKADEIDEILNRVQASIA